MKQIIRGLLGIALLVASAAAPACAEEVKAGDLVITQAWSRATPGGAKIGGGYLTIENKGSTPDRLIGGSGDVASKIEVHEMSMKNGVMTMRPLDNGLTIEPGKTVKLAPGGFHLMLFDLKAPLKQGDKVPVTLEFEKAGKVTLSLDVQGLGAQGPAGAGNPDGQMKNMPGMKM
jgi:copper(I)-binding protein